jgi:hypothetical protein
MNRFVAVVVDIGIAVVARDTVVVAGIVVEEDIVEDTALVDNHNMEDIAMVEAWYFPPR